MGFLKSKSKSKQSSQATSESKNQAYPWIQDNYGGTGANAYRQSTDAISSLLGLNGIQGQDEGFQKFLDSSGYKFNLDTGSKAITGNAAASGLLNSGATAKRLTQYGQELGKNYFSNYLGQLFGLQQSGLGAGQLVSGAGNTAQSQSTSEGMSQSSDGSGIAKAIGSIGAAAAASERRLKTNIVKLGELDNGLPIYSFDYIESGERSVGAMVDEVETIFPEALGPIVDGVQTVDYAVIKNYYNETQGAVVND